MKEGRDHWWHRLLDSTSSVSEPEPIRRTCSSSSTPPARRASRKRASSTRRVGYLAHVAATMKHVFKLKPTDVFWCTADIGWVTGHSYVVYGPLANGATVLMYEGAPDWPERDRFLVADRDVRGHHPVHRADRHPRLHEGAPRIRPSTRACSSLRLLGSVGEPINPEAWIWYQTHIGGGRCPIVDTWWQTETGGIVVAAARRHHHRSPARRRRRFRESSPSWWTTPGRC